MKNILTKVSALYIICVLPMVLASCGSNEAIQETEVTGVTPESRNSGGASVNTHSESCTLPSDITNPCQDSKVVKTKCVFKMKKGKKILNQIRIKCESGKKFKFRFKDGKRVDKKA